MRAKFMFVAVIGWLLAGCVTYAKPVVGIGAVLAIDHHALTVIHVRPNTPASKAGLTSGLVIREIDGVPTAGKDLRTCVAMMRGAAGTKIKLELLDKAHSQTNVVELTRADIIK